MIMSVNCPSCILGQMERIARLHKLERKSSLEMMKKVMSCMASRDWDVPPPLIAEGVYGTVSEFLGVFDPYQDIKKMHIEELLKLYPEIIERVRSSEDPVKSAIVLSALGNTIDFGAELSLEGDVKKVLMDMERVSFHADRTREFIRELSEKKTLLVIGDNAGETVLDRVLIEILGDELSLSEVFYITRGKPVINDATKSDAEASGIGGVAEILDDGAGIPGFYPPRVENPRAKELFFSDDVVVLSKGQGNFETLEGAGRRVYMSFKVKCTPVSELLGVPKGALVFLKNEGA